MKKNPITNQNSNTLGGCMTIVVDMTTTVVATTGMVCSNRHISLAEVEMEFIAMVVTTRIELTVVLLLIGLAMEVEEAHLLGQDEVVVDAVGEVMVVWTKPTLESEATMTIMVVVGGGDNILNINTIISPNNAFMCELYFFVVVSS